MPTTEHFDAKTTRSRGADLAGERRSHLDRKKTNALSVTAGVFTAVLYLHHTDTQRSSCYCYCCDVNVLSPLAAPRGEPARRQRRRREITERSPGVKHPGRYRESESGTARHLVGHPLGCFWRLASDECCGSVVLARVCVANLQTDTSLI